MDGWMDGQTDGRMDGRTDGRTGGRTDGRADGWIYFQQKKAEPVDVDIMLYYISYYCSTRRKYNVYLANVYPICF